MVASDDSEKAYLEAYAVCRATLMSRTRNLVTTVDAFVTRFAPQLPEAIVLRNDQATFIPCCLKVAARSTAG